MWLCVLFTRLISTRLKSWHFFCDVTKGTDGPIRSATTNQSDMDWRADKSRLMSCFIICKEFHFLKRCFNELAHLQRGQTRVLQFTIYCRLILSSRQHFWHILAMFPSVAHEEVNCTCKQIIYIVEIMNTVTYISLFPAIQCYPTLTEEFQFTQSSYLPVTRSVSGCWSDPDSGDIMAVIVSTKQRRHFFLILPHHSSCMCYIHKLSCKVL